MPKPIVTGNFVSRLDLERAIWRHWKYSAMNKSQIADAVGVNPGIVSQVLSGNGRYIKAGKYRKRHVKAGMTRKIVLPTCELCPHRDHKGAYAAVSCKPVCRRASKDLPYTVSDDRYVHASPTYEIPEWCPLPVNS